MKFLGVILNAYTLLLLSISSTNWYAKHYSVIDALDVPIYVLSVFAFVKYFSKLDTFQLASFIGAYLCVVYKWLDYNCLNSSYDVQVFWYLILAGLVPLLFIMRKYIVRLFALDAMANLFGRTWNFPRASRIIFPLFIISGICAIHEVGREVAYPLTLVALYFGFAYFRFNPLTVKDYEYMNDVQKWQYSFKTGYKIEEANEIAVRLKRRFKRI